MSSAVDQLASSIVCRQVRLTALSRPDYLDFSWDEEHVCAIVSRGGALALRLARQLENRGWRVVLIADLQEAAQGDIPTVQADLSNVPGWEGTFASVAARFGHIAAVVDVHEPCDSASDSLLLDAREEARLKSAFFMAKYLKPHLNAPQLQLAWFYIATRIDGQLGLGNSLKTQGVLLAGLFGLAKTLGREWPGVACRAVDLNPDLSEDAAAAFVVSELYDPDRTLAEVGYGRSGRCTIAAQDA